MTATTDTANLEELAAKHSLTALAELVGEQLDLRALGQEQHRIASGPVTMSVEGGGSAVLFRHGCAVFFDVSPKQRQEFLERIRPEIVHPYNEPETERLEIRVDPASREGIEGSTLVLQSACPERLQLVADILSKSVVLALYEARVARDFDRVEPFALNLEHTASTGGNARKLLKHIGAVLLSEHQMVGRVQVEDKPDLLWERPDLERLYARLADEFDIAERHAALERKLDLISSTAQTALGILESHRALRVEWYIVILILFDIALSLFEKYVGW
ncbi:MAG: RMD1 family protein [Planctomycetota bacterium]